MTEEKKQSDRRRLWFWRGAAIVTVIVFFTARSLMRDQLPVHVAKVTRQDLVNTVSTNGRVEPENNYEFYSPIATTVKAVYVQPGDQVPAGKLLLVLDDVQARARVAAAESSVKAAQAAMEAATHNGTQQERHEAAAETTRDRLNREQARHDLDALIKLKNAGAASASEVTDAQQRLDAAEASLHAADESANNRYSPDEVAKARAEMADAEANLEAARQVVAQSSIHAPVAGTVYSLAAGRTDFVEQGKLLLQLADLHHERVRAYFDEPDIGRLAVGQPIRIKWDAKPGQQSRNRDYLWHAQCRRSDGRGRRCGRRTAALYQRQCHGNHFQRAEYAQRTARGAAFGERQALRLQDDRQQTGTYPGDHRNHQSHPGGHSLRTQ
jgi:HlyD family secretion protein